MTEPYYADDSVTLYHGDALEVLRSLDPDSIDAVVTDPPYNLSDSGKRDSDCLRRILCEVQLPHDRHRDAERSESLHLAGPTFSCSPLRRESRAIRVHARVGVPEGAVHLEGTTVAEQKVNGGHVASTLATDSHLAAVADTEAVQDLGDFILTPADSRDTTFCDGTCGCFTEPFPGCVAVLVALPGSPAGDLPSDLLGGGRWGDAHIGSLDDALSESKGSALVVAGTGAVRRAVLRLDLLRGAGELVPADGADHGNLPFFHLRPLSVGACSGARGLSSPSESGFDGGVHNSAHWTFTLHFPTHGINSSRHTAGFMGKEWDGWESPAAFQRWCLEWAREVLRVLKPGGHLLAFGGTRTVHRLTCAIEDAGFEIRDGIDWIYACLTADTEILTEHGWRPGIEVQTGERVAQWDPATGAISLAEVQETYRGPWDGPMRVLRNADTDQMLTPNHRVYHQPKQRRMVQGVRSSWYDGRWQVAEAGQLSTWNPIRLPLAGVHDGPGIGGEDYAALLGWVWTEGGFDMSGSGVRIYQSSVNSAKVAEIMALIDRLGPHKRYEQPRTYTRRNGKQHEYTAVTWFFAGELAERVRADLPGKRPTYELLWRMTAGEKRAMLRAALLGDGSLRPTGGWQFYQQHEDDLVWFQTLLALVGQAGKVGMRPNRPGGAVYLRDRATTELQARHLRDAWEHYTGEVWCVQVPTGAFIARRNGMVFITGNSGFPKSLDVSKAIDKAAGAEREVVGNTAEISGRTIGRGTSAGYHGNIKSGHCRDITAPATEDAKRWHGWGTALKPAREPIVVARKPLVGTVAQNVLRYGTGALNIDATRVPHASESDLKVSLSKNPGRADRVTSDTYGADRPQQSVNMAGRWPTNLVLSHAGNEVDGDLCADGCVPGCPVAELDLQSGNVKAGGSKHGISASGRRGGIMGETVAREQHVDSYGDSGGASRFFPVFRYEPKADSPERPRVNGVAHPTVKPIALMRWLVRLVTPPGGTVLDPFAGSGTTGEACAIEGFRAVLIEREADYLPLIVARLSKPIQPVLDLGVAS